MPDRPKVLCIGAAAEASGELIAHLQPAYDVVWCPDSTQAASQLASGTFAIICWLGPNAREQLAQWLRSERILNGMPDGVALLDADNRVLWANERLRQWCPQVDVHGASFYALFGNPEILGPDFCPFHTALASGHGSSSTFRCNDNQYFQVHAAPVSESNEPPSYLIVSIRDVTREMLQQQKLAAIHKAGVELADLTPEEVFHMSVEERIELLKSNILHYTKDLLSFDVVEIRLLINETGMLVPLLSVGLVPEAIERPLFARPQNNGVTGFVAATGKSYLCEDTMQDPLYIEGCRGAKSSLTVPLMLHDQVIGTFNVESPEPRAFSESDLQFLEIFSRDVAAALNTLELLVAQQANTAQASVEAIHREVALPVDEILNDAVNVMERYIGLEPDVVERLQRILRNARDIKQLIHKVGKEMAPAEAVPHSVQPPLRPGLRHRRVLVVDADESVRGAAHDLLERFGCIVETAHEGGEAIFMIRNSMPDYDVVIADIHLPDMNAYELLQRMKEADADIPLILMTGFGYDPDHTIVKARQAGLPANAILYKPFRLDQLLETVEAMMADRVGVPQTEAS